MQKCGQQGVASVELICPAFAADYLETLEEIELECREAWLAAGCGEFRYIPCLNDAPAHLAMMAQLVTQ